jgi:hypothetical protein
MSMCVNCTYNTGTEGEIFCVCPGYREHGYSACSQPKLCPTSEQIRRKENKVIQINRDTLRLLVPRKCPICRGESILLVLKTTGYATVALLENGQVDLMDESEPDGRELKLDYYRCSDCSNEFYFDEEYAITSEKFFGA